MRGIKDSTVYAIGYPNCARCEAFVAWVKGEGVSVEVVDFYANDWGDMAKLFNVFNFPSYVVCRPAGKPGYFMTSDEEFAKEMVTYWKSVLVEEKATGSQ